MKKALHRRFRRCNWDSSGEAPQLCSEFALLFGKDGPFRVTNADSDDDGTMMLPSNAEQAGSGKSSWFSNIWSRAYVLLTVAALFWAGNSIVGRAAHEVVPPVALAFWRWSVALLLLLPFAWPHLRREWRIIAASWRVMAALAVLGICMFNMMLYTGLSLTTATNGLLIQSAQPAVIMAMGALFMGDRISARQWIGLCIAVLGVLVILTGGHLERLLALRLNMGDALIAAGLLAWGSYSILLRKRPAVHPLSFLTIVIGLGVVAIFPIYLNELASGARIETGLSSLMAIAYVGIFPSVISYLCFNRGVELLGSAQAGLFVNIMPVMGTGMAILFLGEALRAFHVIGLLLALLGIGISTPIAAAALRRHRR